MAVSHVRMGRFNPQMAGTCEGDGGLSKLTIGGGGGKPSSRASEPDGSPSNWNPKGTLTNSK